MMAWPQFGDEPAGGLIVKKTPINQMAPSRLFVSGVSLQKNTSREEEK